MADKGKNHGKHGGHKGGGKKHGGGHKGGDVPTVKSLIRSLLGSSVAGPLSGGGLKKELRAGAKLRYGPLENELDAQLRASQATTKRNNAYFKDYLQRVRGLNETTANYYATAQQQIAQQQQQASQQDSGILEALNADRQGQAELMGASPSDAANPLAAAQAARATSALGNYSRVALQGATQGAYGADQARIARRQKIETAISGQKQSQSIRQQIADLAREKGAFKTDMRRDLREGERGFLVDLLSGPNARKLAHIQGSEARKTDNNAARHSSSSSDHEKANKGKNRRGSRKSAHDAMTELRSLSKKDKRASVGELTRYLVDQGYDPSLARRIARRFVHKQGGGGGGGGGKGKGGGGHAPHQYGPGNHPGPR